MRTGAIVLGLGVAGITLTNLIAQAGVEVLNVGLENVEGIGTLDNQGWASAGFSWIVDPNPNVPIDFYYEFTNYINGIKSASKSGDIIPEIATTKSIAIMNKGMIEGNDQSYFEYDAETKNFNHSGKIIAKKIGELNIHDIYHQKVNKNYWFYNTLDKQYSIAKYLKNIQYYSRLIGAGDRYINEAAVLIKSDDGGVDVLIDGKIYKPKYVFNCCGANSLKLMAGIIPKHLFNKFIDDEFEKKKFSYDLLKSVVVSIPNSIDHTTDVIVNNVEGYSVVKHLKNNNLVFAAGKEKHTDVLDIVTLESLKSMSGNPLVSNEFYMLRKMLETINNFDQSLISNSTLVSLLEADDMKNLSANLLKLGIKYWFCKRIEKKYDVIERQRSIGCFATKIPTYNNLYFGSPGKAILGFYTAQKLLKLSGIAEYEYQFEIKDDVPNFDSNPTMTSRFNY